MDWRSTVGVNVQRSRQQGRCQPSAAPHRAAAGGQQWRWRWRWRWRWLWLWQAMSVTWAAAIRTAARQRRWWVGVLGQGTGVGWNAGTHRRTAPAVQLSAHVAKAAATKVVLVHQAEWARVRQLGALPATLITVVAAVPRDGGGGGLGGGGRRRRRLHALAGLLVACGSM